MPAISSGSRVIDHRFSPVLACDGGLGNQLGYRRSIQSRTRVLADRSNAMSSASSKRPSGSIQKPRTGKKPRTPPQISAIPAGILIQKQDGCRIQRIHVRRRRGKYSISRSTRRSCSVASRDRIRSPISPRSKPATPFVSLRLMLRQNGNAPFGETLNVAVAFEGCFDLGCSSCLALRARHARGKVDHRDHADDDTRQQCDINGPVLEARMTGSSAKQTAWAPGTFAGPRRPASAMCRRGYKRAVRRTTIGWMPRIVLDAGARVRPARNRTWTARISAIASRFGRALHRTAAPSVEAVL